MVAKTRVKICCIGSVEEAQLAIRCGADAVGLVSQMPSGPGVISDELIAQIAAQVPPPIASFLLTSLASADGIAEQHLVCRTNTLQLCDNVTPDVHRQVRACLPGIAIVQVVHVCDESAIELALRYAETADALLLDSGNTTLDIKELGGTGRTHDWMLSARIVESVGLPVFLAGGLNAGNVGSAIRTVRPFGVDVCSGVRTDGMLDERKLATFLAEVVAARG